MKKNIVIIFLLLMFISNNIFGQELNAEQIYAKVNNAVVTIYTYDANGKLLSQGSGIVLNDKGWIVTNYHVYAGAEKLIIKHKEKIVKHTDIIGLDVEKDILILKITDKSFPAIALGNSDLLKVGQKIYAIGSPLGFENTITEGLISGLRSYEEKKQSFIQISAPISPGSSGGAVVDTKGNLIAVTSMSAKEGQNLNFAIPINEIKKIYKEKGVKPNELLASFYLDLANAEIKKKNYNPAIDYLKKAIETNPDYSSAYSNLGFVYSKKKDLDAALLYLKKAISINQEDEFANTIIGAVYGMKKDYKSSLFFLQKAIIINPKYAEAFYFLGAAHSKLENNDSAIIFYKKALLINPNYASAYYAIGIEYSLTDIDTAITYFKKAVSINPQFAEAFYWLGGLYNNKHDLDTAITYLKKAVFINPEYADAYFLLGATYGNKGDVNLEKYYLEKAYQLDPTLKNN
jgi:tetratricopeptide (TPR) repeat protein